MRKGLHSQEQAFWAPDAMTARGGSVSFLSEKGAAAEFVCCLDLASQSSPIRVLASV